MINIAEALRANLRAELSIDPPGALHLRLAYGSTTICDAEVDLPAPAAPDRAAERRREEADAIAEARTFADGQGRSVALLTLALADAHAEIKRLHARIALAPREGGP